MTTSSIALDLDILNLYATLARLRSRLGITTTANDDDLFSALYTASRSVDLYTERFFYSKNATEYYDTATQDTVTIADLLTLTTLKDDPDFDGTFSGDALTENEDFRLEPYNSYPKDRVTGLVGSQRREIEIVGVWGYGNGKSATPYNNTGLTTTVVTADGTTITVSADDVILPGHTILSDTEQMFVTAVGTGSFTAVRGVNGTTASAQSASMTSIYNYPGTVAEAALLVASRLFDMRNQNATLKQEKIGDYSYQRFGASGGPLTDIEAGPLSLLVNGGLI